MSRTAGQEKRSTMNTTSSLNSSCAFLLLFSFVWFRPLKQNTVQIIHFPNNAGTGYHRHLTLRRNIVAHPLTTNGPSTTRPPNLLVLGQECDWSGAFLHPWNCRHMIRRWMGPVCGTTGTTNSAIHRGLTWVSEKDTWLQAPAAETAMGLPDRWLEGSPTTKWTTPLRTLMTSSEPEALRTWPAVSRVCSRAMMWSRLAAMPASSSESSQGVQVRWTLVCAYGRRQGRCRAWTAD